MDRWPIPVDDNCRWNPVRGCHWGKEIISRYRTSINNLNEENLPVFSTDLNGRGALKRIKNKRPSYEFDVIEADGEVAGNYYPISSSISISDEVSDDSFTVLVDRGQAGGSLKSGQIDLMLHRRLTSRSVSGDRFLGEKLDEAGQFGDGLIVRGRHLILINAAAKDVKVSFH